MDVQAGRLRLPRAARATASGLALVSLLVVVVGTLIGTGIAGAAVIDALGQVGPADLGATINQLAALPALFGAAIVFTVREGYTPAREQAGWIALAAGSVGVAAGAMSTLYRNSESLTFIVGFAVAAAVFLCVAGYVIARALVPRRHVLIASVAVATGVVTTALQLWIPGVLAGILAVAVLVAVVRGGKARSAA